VKIHKRSEWQTSSQPVTGPAYPKSRIRDVLYHYPGGGTLASYQNPVAKLRAMQNDYLTSPNRGYSLGYNFCIDLVGEVWEVRGTDIKSAATGGYNDFSTAVQFFVPGVQPASLVQLTTAVELHKHLENFHGKELGVFGHFQKGTTTTPCPGEGIKLQLPTIETWVHGEPIPPIPPPPFDPNSRQYGLWPIKVDKPHLVKGAKGDAVRYLQGVMHFEVCRFAGWFFAIGQGTPEQRDWLNYLATVIYPLNGNGIYDDTMIHAVYSMQMAFNYSAYDNQHIGPMELDGTVGPLTWSFIDHLADGAWY